MTEIIDITMTATIRPLIIYKTLQSFTQNMLFDKNMYRLIINIDPIGENVSREEVLKMTYNFFNQEQVIYNYPETPGFTKAVQWCWSKSNSKYVFHLEDDWTLLSKVRITEMIEILNDHSNLSSLRLNKIHNSKSKQAIDQGFIYWPKIALNPTLFKGDFVQSAAPLMDIDRNPEKQLRKGKTEIGKFVEKWNHGIYVMDGFARKVEDIGRDWMEGTKYTKKTGFLNWEEK